MKVRTHVLILILISVVLIISEGYANDKITKRDYRFISGIWANEDYNEIHHWRAEIIIEPDGTYTEYTKTSNLKPNKPGKIVLTEKWTDSEGNSWYKYEDYAGAYFEGKKVSHYAVMKINKSRTIREMWMFNTDYPTELIPDGPNYNIHYRQE